MEYRRASPCHPVNPNGVFAAARYSPNEQQHQNRVGNLPFRNVSPHAAPHQNGIPAHVMYRNLSPLWRANGEATPGSHQSSPCRPRIKSWITTGLVHPKKELGQGSFGQALLATVDPNAQPVKHFPPNVVLKVSNDSRCTGSALKEIEILRMLRHPNIVQFIDCWQECNPSRSAVKQKESSSGLPHNHDPSSGLSGLYQGKLIIAMEYCNKGDLANLVTMQKKAKVLFSARFVVSSTLQLVSAIHGCHMNHIIHRDVKPANIFLSDLKGLNDSPLHLSDSIENHVQSPGQQKYNNLSIVLGDFGISRPVDFTSAAVHTRVGTPYYMCPEICQGHPYTDKSDIWAIGIVLYELLTLKRPFSFPVPADGKTVGKREYEVLYDRICRYDATGDSNGPFYRVMCEKIYPSWIMDLCISCLRKDPGQRPSATYILTCFSPRDINPLLKALQLPSPSSVRIEAIRSRSISPLKKQKPSGDCGCLPAVDGAQSPVRFPGSAIPKNSSTVLPLCVERTQSPLDVRQNNRPQYPNQDARHADKPSKDRQESPRKGVHVDPIKDSDDKKKRPDACKADIPLSPAKNKVAPLHHRDSCRQIHPSPRHVSAVVEAKFSPPSAANACAAAAVFIQQPPKDNPIEMRISPLIAVQRNRSPIAYQYYQNSSNLADNISPNKGKADNVFDALKVIRQAQNQLDKSSGGATPVRKQNPSRQQSPLLQPSSKRNENENSAKITPPRRHPNEPVGSSLDIHFPISQTPEPRSTPGKVVGNGRPLSSVSEDPQQLDKECPNREVPKDMVCTTSNTTSFLALPLVAVSQQIDRSLSHTASSESAAAFRTISEVNVSVTNEGHGVQHRDTIPCVVKSTQANYYSLVDGEAADPLFVSMTEANEALLAALHGNQEWFLLVKVLILSRRHDRASMKHEVERLLRALSLPEKDVAKRHRPVIVSNHISDDVAIPALLVSPESGTNTSTSTGITTISSSDTRSTHASNQVLDYSKIMTAVDNVFEMAYLNKSHFVEKKRSSRQRLRLNESRHNTLETSQG